MAREPKTIETFKCAQNYDIKCWCISTPDDWLYGVFNFDRAHALPAWQDGNTIAYFRTRKEARRYLKMLKSSGYSKRARIVRVLVVNYIVTRFPKEE